MLSKRIVTTLSLLLLLPGYVQAQIDVRAADAEMFSADVEYNPAIPRPAEVLGHELGAAPVRHHKLVEYLTSVANMSDRLSVEVIGYTHERRPILFLVATSAANRARLDEIREQHVALTEPERNQAISDDMPIVTWLNYGVHGAESSGMDAALPFVYHLAAAEGDEIDRVLDDSVILVTAIFNPDGHAQRVSWLDAFGGEINIGDPAHLEHTFNWTFARTNHYWFDLNRQWLLLTQPESRAWMKKWHEWRPNLTIDYHEMGSEQTYYFHPGVATRTNPLVPDEAERLMAETVKTSEAFLDSEARLYFHGERFDNYYIGKGSTFPLVNGGVGVLYEAAAALGREIDTGNGLRTYRENIRKHFRTSIASIDAGSRMRMQYLRYQKSFYENAVRDAAKQSVKAWVFAAPGDPARMHHFADLLNYHRIETFKLKQDVNAGGIQYRADEALIVPVNQAQNTLIRSIFETINEFEDATFYDVSTWTLPPAFGLDYAPLSGRGYRASMLGEAHAPAMPIAAEPAISGYGYLFEWSGYYAPRALQRVLQKDLLAKVAIKPFSATTTTGVTSFKRGSILIPFDRQESSRESIHELMQQIAAEDGVTVHALASGRSANGTAGIDIGGPSFRALRKPKILLVAGDAMNLYEAGEAWHLLDYRMGIPVVLRDRDDLGGIAWNKYTHIVMPSGDFDEYEPKFAARMRQWIAEGGTLIGIRDAATWVRANTLDWVEPEGEDALATAELPEFPEEEEEQVERTAYSEKDNLEAVDIIGGAIFSADLDNTHPLGFGFPRRPIHLHKNMEEPMENTANPYSVVIAYDDEPVMSGYVSDKNVEALAGTAALIAERSGAGSVILFADNPNFRGYWYGTNKLFLNSLFFSRVFDAPAED
ncbi:MAG: peptidase [Gammaproteobacteria bacterium]|nr:peptidase [Gammaproteobacteria bacterium]